MLTFTLLAVLALGGGARQEPPADTAAGYAAIVQQVRSAYPTHPVVLSETSSDVECTPHCGDTSGRQQHSAVVIQALKGAGLVDARCRVSKDTLGCRDFSKHLFIALGPPTVDTPEGGSQVEGGLWVMAVTHLPCRSGCSPRSIDAGGYRHLLKQDQQGAWQVIRLWPQWVT